MFTRKYLEYLLKYRQCDAAPPPVPSYQKMWRDYVKYRHLLANLPKPSMEDKRKLVEKESQLQTLRLRAKLKRDVTVAVSSQGFRRTGLMADVVQVGGRGPYQLCRQQVWCHHRQRRIDAGEVGKRGGSFRRIRQGAEISS